VLRRERGKSREKEGRRPVIRKKRKSSRIRESREEGQVGFPKGLYAISENCRDLSVK
jgi:hypothetical protein